MSDVDDLVVRPNDGGGAVPLVVSPVLVPDFLSSLIVDQPWGWHP